MNYYYVINFFSPKDGTVWNIIDHATSEANQDGNPSESGVNDVQQIIYIAYDDNDISNKETSVHIVNQNTLVIHLKFILI